MQDSFNLIFKTKTRKNLDTKHLWKCSLAFYCAETDIFTDTGLPLIKIISLFEMKLFKFNIWKFAKER